MYPWETYEEIAERNNYIPLLPSQLLPSQQYKSSGVSEVDTYPENDPLLLFNQIKKKQLAPLWRINEKTKVYYTLKPISVKIYREDDLFFVENENLLVCGTGKSPQEALQDFSLHIIHFYEYYNKIEDDKLMGDALRLKKIYKNLFEVK